MITTCNTAPVNYFPLLVWGQKCPGLLGLLECSSTPVLYYRMLQTDALARVNAYARALRASGTNNWRTEVEQKTGIEGELTLGDGV